MPGNMWKSTHIKIMETINKGKRKKWGEE